MRQAIAYSVDRERINEISARNTAFPGHGILPNYYKDFFAARGGLPVRPGPRQADPRRRGLGPRRGGVREKDGQKLSFNLYVRSESQDNIQAAKLIKEMAAEVGIEFKVQVVSVDKLTELTTQKVDGKAAPDFDTFIWGWGGDPYDPSTLLSSTTSQIGGSSDSFYSNPEYDRLFDEQAGEFDVDKRKAIVKQLVEMSQRDLPYLVLTEDPILQAYRTDRLNVDQLCPKHNGDLFCEQVPTRRCRTSRRGGGVRTRAAAKPPAAVAVADRLRGRRLVLGSSLTGAGASASRWRSRNEFAA